MRNPTATALVLLATIAIGVSQSRFAGNAPVTPGTRVGKTEPTKTASAKKPPRVDRRYAVTRGDWSAATVSLFNTWSALDDNPGRHMSVYSPDRRKTIEVVGADITLRIGSRSFETDVNNVPKHDADLGWPLASTKFFVTMTENGA